MPGTSVASQAARGIASGDLVRLRHRRHGILKGYAVLDKRKNRVGTQHDGRQVSVKVTDAMLLARNHGYRVATEANN